MKSRKVKFILFFFLIFGLTGTLSAQELIDTTSFSMQQFTERGFSTGVDKQLNTYLFSNYLKYGISGKYFFGGIKEIFNSTIVNTAQKNIKDEHNLFAIGGYRFSENLITGITFNNISFADDRQTQINKTSLLNTKLFLQYNPLNGVSITPFAGFSSNQQINESDNGLIYGTDIRLNSLMISDFEVNSIVKFQTEDIAPRRNLLRNAALNLTNNFEDNFTNTLSASFSEQRKDFYFTADAASENNSANNIQSRTETTYAIQNRFRSFPVSEGISAELAGSLYWRTIDRDTRYNATGAASSLNYDTQINELKIDLSGGLEYKSDLINSSLKFSFAQYEEKHEARKIEGIDYLIFTDREKVEFKKNNQAETALLSLITTLRISENDNFVFSIFHRKLKYDTPSIENFDDRDELLTIGRLGYERKFSDLLKMTFNLEGSMNKIVYIFSERSSNNSIRRYLKFSAGETFSNGIFTTNNAAEVSANYTTFDYEYLNPSLRSYSFRQFIARDSSAFQVTRKVRLTFYGYIKLSEQGDFSWSNFSERPARILNEKLLEPKIGYYAPDFSLAWGIRYFDLLIYNVGPDEEKLLSSEYRSIGPISEIRYRVSSRINFTFLGWYEFITGDNLKREVPNLILKLNWQI